MAFKYQRTDPSPGVAALHAFQLGMIPTTSGDQTGRAPSINKIQLIRNTLPSESPLAVASGMTPENIEDYLPYVSHYLVSTGISSDGYHFDLKRLEQFIKAVHQYSQILNIRGSNEVLINTGYYC